MPVRVFLSDDRVDKILNALPNEQDAVNTIIYASTSTESVMKLEHNQHSKIFIYHSVFKLFVIS